MTLLIATPKATDANAYLTVARANEIMRRRPGTTDWDAATAVPSAEGYVTSGTVASGQTAVPLVSGTGSLASGDLVKFAGHATEYTVGGSGLAAAGTLTISPALTASLASGEAMVRLTASGREKAIIWATRILEGMMDWRGSIRTVDQALRWPRSGVVDDDGRNLDYDTIPARLEEATAELALFLLGRDTFVMPSLLGQGFSRAKVGSLEVVVDDKQVVEAIPSNILALLEPLGCLKDVAQMGARAVRLIRT